MLLQKGGNKQLVIKVAMVNGWSQGEDYKDLLLQFPL